MERKITPTSILIIYDTTIQLVKNHTATVELRTDQPLTESQKNNAKAALAKKLKEMVTGEFKKYNSNASYSDAPADPAFCSALAHFFATLPGYEKVWGELCVGYEEQLELQNSIKRLTKT